MDKAPDAFRTISEVADELDVPQHVLRFWETRFAQIRPMKRGGGRRYYRPDDVDLLRGIRHLLYGEGYTIRGVQGRLKEKGLKFVQNAWRQDPAMLDAARGTSSAGSPPKAEPANDQPQAQPVDDEEDVATMQASQNAERPPSSIPADRAVAGGAHAPARVNARDASPATPTLSRDDVRRLQAALYELGECRRLLEIALKDE